MNDLDKLGKIQLSKEEVEAIKNAYNWHNQQMLVSSKHKSMLVQGLTELHSFSCDRLTPLGLALKQHIEEQSE